MSTQPQSSNQQEEFITDFTSPTLSRASEAAAGDELITHCLLQDSHGADSGSDSRQREADHTNGISRAFHTHGSSNSASKQSEHVNMSKKRKRQVSPASRMAYPRKRAIAACHLCRTRKTKCDNQRPTCGSCRRQDTECVYQDSTFDRSSFDGASVAILDRLDHVVDLLESRKVTQHTPHASRGSISRSPYVPQHLEGPEYLAESLDNSDARQTPGSKGQTLPFPYDYDTPIYFESAETAANYHGSCEDILEWPIFEGRYDRREVEKLIFSPEAESLAYGDAADGKSTTDSNKLRKFDGEAKRGRGVEEEDVVQLVQIFMANVHTKNPVVEISDLIAMAKTIAEQGFRWDAQSCLVLIACALATLSSPFSLSTAVQNGGSPDYTDSVSDTPGYAAAEDYYLASCKRLGLLGNSIVATQCHFLHGVYEMYSMRPLQAWISFNRACVTFQTLLRKTRGHPRYPTTSTESIEHRLYWSCLKSEHEMRIEVKLPPSGLSRFSYPDCFPSPPASSPSLVASHPRSVQDKRFPSVSASTMDVVHEKSWYYYLAEIAARRIFIRVTTFFYSTDERAWLRTPIDQTIRIAGELESQWRQWRDHIPYPVAFEDDRISEDELTFHLQARAAEVRERIYRPFLYLAIELEPDGRQQEKLTPLVRKHISACFELVHQWAIRFRHHGTWFGIRQMFSAGVLLLAAVKSQVIEIPEGEWSHAAGLVVNLLRYWEQEAPDLKILRLFMEDIIARLERDTARPRHAVAMPP